MNQESKLSTVSMLAEIFRGIFPILYFVMGLIQFASIQGGLTEWWNLHWFFASIIALPIAYSPIIGALLGTLGAIDYFGWSPWFSFFLFFWPYLIFLSLFILSFILSKK